METIYQQAIAEAKAIRASAMANAKSALQEAFEPQIKEMVRLKLSEELEEDYDEQEIENMEEGMHNDMEEGMDHSEMEEGVTDDSLEEILAELEELTNEEEDTMEEGYDEPVNEDLEEIYEEFTNEDEEEETEDEEETEEAAEAEEETEEITVSLGDLKDLIDKIKSLNPELASNDEMEMDAEDSEEEISLDEILAELEKDSEHSKMEERKQVKTMATKKDSTEKELKLANETIAELSNSLNEVNLLNAKLLYMNKIFKAKSLTESEKINIVKAFDKAATVREVKNTFEILKETATSKKKSYIRESFGYASKPAGVSPRANVIESDPFIDRWQKLAGL